LHANATTRPLKTPPTSSLSTARPGVSRNVPYSAASRCRARRAASFLRFRRRLTSSRHSGEQPLPFGWPAKRFPHTTQTNAVRRGLYRPFAVVQSSQRVRGRPPTPGFGFGSTGLPHGQIVSVIGWRLVRIGRGGTDDLRGAPAGHESTAC